MLPIVFRSKSRGSRLYSFSAVGYNAISVPLMLILEKCSGVSGRNISVIFPTNVPKEEGEALSSVSHEIR